MIRAVRPVSLISASLPFVVAVSIVIVSFLPLGTSDDLLTLGPQLVLCFVFFWAVHAPGRMPPLAIFVFGLAIDLFSAGPLGFWGLIYLSAYGLTLLVRGWLVKKGGLVLWAAFSGLAALSAALAWALGSVYFTTLIPLWPLAVAGAVTIAVFPVLSWLFTRIAPVAHRTGE